MNFLALDMDLDELDRFFTRWFETPGFKVYLRSLLCIEEDLGRMKENVKCLMPDLNDLCKRDRRVKNWMIVINWAPASGLTDNTTLSATKRFLKNFMMTVWKNNALLLLRWWSSSGQLERKVSYVLSILCKDSLLNNSTNSTAICCSNY